MLLFGPAWGLLSNVLIYLPFTIFLTQTAYTGHAGQARVSMTSFRLADIGRIIAAARMEPRIITMIVLGGVTSFFVGVAFQAQMPEYAQYLGPDETGARYSILLAANAAGAVLGVLLLESANVHRPNVQAAIVCAGLWGVTMALFPLTRNYVTAVALLVLSGVFSIAFTSIAQTLVQILAPASMRGAIVGLFNTSLLGLRAGSGLTVGILGAAIGIRLSLVLSSLMVVLIAIVLFVRDVRSGRRQVAEVLP
jgi:sugar phosphate permease